MNTQEIIETIRRRPDMVVVVAQLNQTLTEEQKKRQQFYALIHEDVKAEFINGEVIMQSPVKRKHWKIVNKLSAHLTMHVDQDQLGEVGSEKVLIQCTRNDYEPDIVFFTKEKADIFTADQMLFPPPDLVVEVLSESTRDRDYGIKFKDYAAHRLAEYWIIDPDEQSVEQYALREDNYQLYQKLVREGSLKSLVIAGFAITLSEIFK
ncbi:MAG: Uma2 family endonuclease [Bacteroidia bacterium]|nr:Uma2 family endonuclease [Bacteroidia bacterium]